MVEMSENDPKWPIRMNLGTFLIYRQFMTKQPILASLCFCFTIFDDKKWPRKRMNGQY